MTKKIEISHKTIIFTVVLLATIWLVLEIRDILFLLFISFIIMSAIRPLVEYLEKFKIPPIVSIFLVYALVISFFVLGVGGLLPPLIIQTTRFINNFPRYINIISPYFQIDSTAFTQQLAPIGENLVKVTIGFFSNIFTSVTVLVFTFYLILERKHLEKYLAEFVGTERADKISQSVKAVEYGLGSWLRGELLLMLIIGVVSYIGLSILRVDFALPLAILAGIMEIVPVIGPLLSGVPAVLVAITVSPLLALATAALYFIIHQLENTFVVPLVMNKAVGLSPLITIIALMIGSRLAGGVGAVLAIPIVVVLRSVLISLFGPSKQIN